MATFRFLNADVERVVVADETLFVAWCLTIDTVDPDIDPTHNPSWVQARKARELEHLTKLQTQISSLMALRNLR